MKCAEVRPVLIEYTEGALGAADEMCIDIHLIQCEDCRAEIAGLRELIDTVVCEVRSCEERDDPAAFLDRLHAIEAAHPRPRRRTSIPVVRMCAAAAVAAFAASMVLLGFVGPAWPPTLESPIAEARTREVSARDWAPILRQERGLIDLSALGLVDSPRMDAARGGD